MFSGGRPIRARLSDTVKSRNATSVDAHKRNRLYKRDRLSTEAKVSAAICVWAFGAIGTFGFYRLTGIDEEHPRSATALASCLWPALALCTIGILIDEALRR